MRAAFFTAYVVYSTLYQVKLLQYISSTSTQRLPYLLYWYDTRHIKFATANMAAVYALRGSLLGTLLLVLLPLTVSLVGDDGLCNLFIFVPFTMG